MRFSSESKRECVLAIRRINSILNSELNKSAEEQDSALISECIDNLLFFRRELASIRACKREQKARASRSGFSALTPSMRRVVLIPLCVVLLLAAGATAAQAAGFRVWSALVHMDANYLRVDYPANPDSNPYAHGDKASPGDRLDFSTETDMLDSFSRFGILYPAELEGFRFKSANAAYDGNVCRSLHINLTDDIGRGLTISAFLNGSGPETYSIWYGGPIDEYKKVQLNGIEFTYVIGREYTAVTFAVEHDLYELRGNVDLEEIETIAASMFE